MDFGSGRESENPSGEYFPGDEGERTRRRMLRIGVRPAEEEAGLRERTRSRTMCTDPDRGPLYNVMYDVFGVPSFCLW